ncbi:hypothetical protein PP175_28285 (plasmid) [Aneurinibacillus sp. Ricciae_BoGa-3]|uniref:hypothetical protein n=1 Tax=Aneurinibacillus sp. Ricciae_BoGa-3 TaxID=3022697 RepID=UPI002340ED54|nr:hypothetical protein [Aneurinibacillus sp. Ricciae_BoGa-3]WCK57090.1 hypothetical protein PP175_28285 [Aneurinibacillus sp. Ricciae_BoGa-3]
MKEYEYTCVEIYEWGAKKDSIIQSYIDKGWILSSVWLVVHFLIREKGLAVLS